MEECRISSMELNKAYFFTASIHKWLPILTDDFKEIILESLFHLKKKELIEVYGYVIMPNHIHLLWQMLKMNGKEKPNTSLLKFTAHEFKKRISNSNFNLEMFQVDASNKKYEFWQRDSMAINLYSRNVVEQKLLYTHNNPLKPNWNLCQAPEDYRYSSAAFYYNENAISELITHYMKVF